MNYYFLSILTTILLLASCTKSDNALTNTPNLPKSKKGIGLTESAGFGKTQLEALQVGWYYNWGLQTAVSTDIPFVPMVWGRGGLDNLTQNYPYLLGFNEPDNVNQSNIPVDSALAYWSILSSSSISLGSPSTAGNPLTSGSWLQQFMQSSPRVDFITVHWYKGVDTSKFYDDMTQMYQLFNKPLWVTEFAPQTVSSAYTNPTKYRQGQVDTFIVAVTRWMNAQSFIQRYAWHDAKYGTSAIFDSTGALTPTGLTYGQVK
jgi:hypothetical protein